MKSAFLHLAGDAAISLGVVIVALLIGWTGWLWLDPAVSIVIAAVILWSSWGVPIVNSIPLAHCRELVNASSHGRGCPYRKLDPTGV